MNRNVQIALVGGQPMPVYLGILESHPDNVVLIHSASTKGQAERIAKDCEVSVEMQELDPVDMMVIMPKVAQILEWYADDNVSINLTGGTKSWTIAFTLLAQDRNNTQLLYVDQNCTFYNYTQHTKWQSKVNLDMEQLMRLNGQFPQSHTLLSDYNDDDLESLRRVKILRNYAPIQFNALTIPDKKWRKTFLGSNEGKHDIDGGSYVAWNKAEHRVKVVILKKEKLYEETFDSPHALNIVFYSGWFEYEIAQYLTRWGSAKDVWMNVVYPYRAGLPKNEIDIVVNTGVKLLMVECKTQIFDNTDIDKFHTAVKNYGGMGCKALLVTQSKMKDFTIEKCNDNQVLPFCLSDYKSKRQIHLNLYQMLNKEIVNINAK